MNAIFDRLADIERRLESLTEYLRSFRGRPPMAWFAELRAAQKALDEIIAEIDREGGVA